MGVVSIVITAFGVILSGIIRLRFQVQVGAKH
jgi:hypothetical protein